MTEREKAKTLHDVMMDKVMTERQIDVSLYLPRAVNLMCLDHLGAYTHLIQK